MPAIRLNFEFDIKAFEETVEDSNLVLNHLLNEQIPKLNIKERLDFCLEPFTAEIKGNTHIGTLRSSLYEAVHKANPQLFAGCRGVELWFDNKLLDIDSDTIIDIVGLWHGSKVVISPSKSVLQFVDAFLNFSELSRNTHCLHSLIWNALNESVKGRNLQIWDMFCTEILQHWLTNKRLFANQARVFLGYLLQFDPHPLRSFCGCKLMNVMMGTELSVEILKKLLIDQSILWEVDEDGTNPLTHCILENDMKALEYIMEFGIDLDTNIDDTNTIYDFIMIYGSFDMNLMAQDYERKLKEKKEIIQNHEVFLKEEFPMDLVNEIGGFLLGSEIMKPSRDSEKEEEEKKENEDKIFDEIEQSILTYCKEEKKYNDLSSPNPDSIEFLSACHRQESSANNLYEIEERLSIISCASH